MLSFINHNGPARKQVVKIYYFYLSIKPCFMKKFFLLPLMLVCTILFYSCQKEKSFESSAERASGSLQSDAGGECLPKTVNGVYEAGTALNSSDNYIDVQLNVSRVGSYTVSTDTVNGVFFRATGNFANTGLSTIRLLGSGTPVTAGSFFYEVQFDTSVCAVAVSVLPQGGGVPAVFTLAGAPDVCLDYQLAGVYTVGTAMTAANTVIIKVNVTTAGTYDVTTQTSNGITFSGSGVLAMGAQTITLTASGTPAAAGSTNIPVDITTSACSFTVDVSSQFDYFPRTANSNWSYQFNDDANDSIWIRAKAGNVVLDGNTYTLFEAADSAADFFDYGVYRRSGGDYHTYLPVDDTRSIDYVFLKDNVPQNTTWESDSVGVEFSGIPVYIRIVLTIEQKDINVAVGGITYPNTIVVREKYEFFNGVAWTDMTDQVGYYKSYYSRSVGLIKFESYYEDGNANPPLEYKQELRRYQVF